MLRARLRWQSKARKESLMSHGRLSLCSTTKILLALISRATSSTDTTSRKSAIEEKMIWKVTLSSALIFFLQKIFARLTSLFLFFLFSFETVWDVFLFQIVGRLIVPDIIFRDRTCLVFCFLGCVVKFQAREAIKQLAEKRELESWQSSLCAFCLSFFLFFFFSFLLLAFFLLYLYFSFIKLVSNLIWFLHRRI